MTPRERANLRDKIVRAQLAQDREQQHRHYGTWTRERMDAGAAALAALKAAVERRCRCRPGAIWPGCPRHDSQRRKAK